MQREHELYEWDTKHEVMVHAPRGDNSILSNPHLPQANIKTLWMNNFRRRTWPVKLVFSILIWPKITVYVAKWKKWCQLNAYGIWRNVSIVLWNASHLRIKRICRIHRNMSPFCRRQQQQEEVPTWPAHPCLSHKGLVSAKSSKDFYLKLEQCYNGAFSTYDILFSLATCNMSL